MSELHHTTRSAIAVAILTFSSSLLAKRALRAAFTMDYYRQKIDQSLSDIQEKSSCLMREVNMSRAHKDRNFQEQVLYGQSLPFPFNMSI